jgi:SpoIIAA-like
MIEVLPDMPEGVTGIRVSGRLRGDDLREFKPAMEELLKSGEIRIVEVVAPDYEGFGPGGLIEDLKLGLGALIQHHSAFKRIAVVSDMHWVAHALPPSHGWSPASSPCSASTSSSGPRSGPPADSLARPTAARRWAKRVAPPRWPRRPVLKGLNVCDDRRDGRPDNQNPNRNRDGRGDQRHRVQFHFHDSSPHYGRGRIPGSTTRRRRSLAPQ